MNTTIEKKTKTPKTITIAAVFGTHGNQGFASVCRVKDVEAFRKIAAECKAGYGYIQPEDVADLLTPGRFVRCDGWASVGEADENTEVSFDDGVRGMYSRGRIHLCKVRRLPPKA